MARDSKHAKNVKSHLVNKDALKRYQGFEGWDDKVLAEEAEVSLKTLTRIWNDIPVAIRSINSLARALNITCDKLLLFETPSVMVFPPGWGPAVKVPVKPSSRFTVKLTLAIPFTEFDKSERMISFIDILKEMIVSTGEVIISGLEEGSTIVSLSMNAQDTLRMLAKMLDGKLASVNIIRIEMPDESWLVRMIVSLKLLGTPVEPDEETWSELLNAKEVESVVAGWSKKFS